MLRENTRPEYIQPNSQLYNILLREDFRQFLITHQSSNEYVIDIVEFSVLPNIIGCFQQSNTHWIVYENDERSHPMNLVAHEDASSAFIDAADRNGLVYIPRIHINNSNHSSVYRALLCKKLTEAIRSQNILIKLNISEKTEKQINSDISLLRQKLYTLRRASSNRMRQTKTNIFFNNRVVAQRSDIEFAGERLVATVKRN